jgi:hypothetical protein
METIMGEQAAYDSRIPEAMLVRPVPPDPPTQTPGFPLNLA